MNQETFEALLAKLGQGWKWEKGSWWLHSDAPLDVRAITRFLLSQEARFVAITAMELPDREIRLDYHWDLDGRLLSFVTATREHQIDTIVDLSPAADWVERETHEYFAVEFLGRQDTKPLMIRSGDPAGIHLRHEEAAQ